MHDAIVFVLFDIDRKKTAKLKDIGVYIGYFP